MKLPKSIRIESDGTPIGTKVFDAESGVRIHGIRAIEWSVSVGKAAVAKIEFVVVNITALGDAAARNSTVLSISNESD